MSCGVGHRCSSDPRLDLTPAWELPYPVDKALKKQQKQKENVERPAMSKASQEIIQEAARDKTFKNTDLASV